MENKEKDDAEEKYEKATTDISLLKGRIFRKATEPVKPLAPQKRKHKLEHQATLDKANEAKRPCSKSERTIVTKKFVVKCRKDELSHETVVTEDQEEIFRNSLSAKRSMKNYVEVCLGDLVPDGLVKTSDIKLKLFNGSDVRLSCEYSPTD